MRERFIAILTVLSKPVVALSATAVIGAAIIGFAWYTTNVSPSGKYASVTSGPISEEVDVSGLVKAAHNTDLAFQTSGRIAQINVQVGDTVYAGQTLAALDDASQAAAVALAQANLEAAQAKLASIVAGTRPEQLSINQTTVTQTENELASALSVAYTNADDAVHAKADQVFINPRNATAQLAILVPDVTLSNRLQTERVALEPLFVSWQAALASTNTAPSSVALSEENLKSITVFLDDLTTALAEAQPNGSISETMMVGYQTSANIARLNVSGALSSLIAADTAYKAATGALTLAQAGATQNDIDAQKAAVDAAQAAVLAAKASVGQTVIAAPVAGTITVQNANLGETVVPGAPLISMIALGKYEADAEISEADIAKIKVNDAVEATFDEYPGVTFPATVTTVDPAADMSGGVASYGITVTFLVADARLKPGLSANLHIETASKDSVLVVPASAIITNGDQKFVYVKNGNNVTHVPVTVGIESAAGMVEIISGLSEGQSVLTFGASMTP
jgi:HlyD family secretion protein